MVSGDKLILFRGCLVLDPSFHSNPPGKALILLYATYSPLLLPSTYAPVFVPINFNNFGSSSLVVCHLERLLNPSTRVF